MEKLSGPLLIFIAAVLWGTDSLFRFPAAGKLDPTVIVFCEHALGLLFLVPWIFWRHRPGLFQLGIKGWLSVLIVGAGGGAIATVLFTAAFHYVNPSVVLLLQKIQTILVVLLAYVFLGEKPAPKFYPWAAVALLAAVVLSFPDFDFSFLREPGNLHTKGLSYALIACAIWGVSTVVGKSLLTHTGATVATFWRYLFGFATLAALMILANIPLDMPLLTSRDSVVTLTYLSFVSGLIPMLAYYAGLRRTPASTATFIELLYPVGAVVLNTIFLHTPLTAVQMGAGAVLLFAVTMITV